jgi:transketolase
MKNMHDLQVFIERKAYNIRLNSLLMTSMAGSGHPTSCLSAADIVATLFFYAMHHDPKHFDNPNNDRFILSKGHAAPVLYTVWKELGMVTEEELLTYRDIHSNLEGHPTLRFPYAEAATGSLGMGLSIGAGMALVAQRDKRSAHTFVLLGDSELSEGSVWEAIEIAAYYKLNNLVAIVDCNRLGQSTETMHAHHVQRYADKFEAFGWKAIVVDGHDIHHLMGAFDKARESEDRPVMIIAKTIKGYGVERVENKMGFHGKAFTNEQMDEILPELEARFPQAAAYAGDEHAFMPTPPATPFDTCPSDTTQGDRAIVMPDPHITQGEYISTRKAYGQALAALGGHCKAVVSLDAEVKNSTYADIFEEKFPERFFQCFIAEQNMVSMGVGMQRRGKVPFISTFGAFFSRAHDQVRMAAIGSSALRLVGSHAGVSIGQDGPSQMALEDIALMRAIPGSVVLYPCDGVSTHKLVAQMAAYNDGITYLRTTRMDTPVWYPMHEEFPIGGCKVLMENELDQVCIVAAGITVVEAMKAHDLLLQENISVAVIDLYSIKPLDYDTLLRVGTQANKCIITVEDHYREGGLGEAVLYALRNSGIAIQCLAVSQLPRSGKPEELLAMMGIDAAGIMKAVKALK